MTSLTAPELLDRLGLAADALAVKIAPLTDAEARAATELPGWSRGHLLAHLAQVSTAVARQVEYAVRGELIDFYDAGQSGRTQAIEMAAGHSADEHRAAVTAGLTRALGALDGLSPEQWELPVSYRNGTVREVALAYWRELVIHLADLQLGRGPETWSKDFCLYLIDFLTPRVPAELRLKLLPVALPPLSVGAGEHTVSISGMITDLAAWLAGRTPSLGSLRAEAAADSVPLPTLLPWPSPTPVK